MWLGWSELTKEEKLEARTRFPHLLHEQYQWLTAGQSGRIVGPSKNIKIVLNPGESKDEH